MHAPGALVAFRRNYGSTFPSENTRTHRPYPRAQSRPIVRARDSNSCKSSLCFELCRPALEAAVPQSARGRPAFASRGTDSGRRRWYKKAPHAPAATSGAQCSLHAGAQMRQHDRQASAATFDTCSRYCGEGNLSVTDSGDSWFREIGASRMLSPGGRDCDCLFIRWTRVGGFLLVSAPRSPTAALIWNHGLRWRSERC